MRERVLVAVVLAAGLLFMTGCGDDGGGDGGAGAAEFLSSGCQDAIQGFVEVQTRFSEATAGAFGGTDINFEDAAEQVRALADAAPAEIRDALQTYADELVPYFEAVADLGLEPREAPTPDQVQQLAAITDDLDQDSLRQAGERIETWFEEECGAG